MKQSKQKSTVTLLAAALLATLVAPTTKAVVFVEPADAGQTLSTAAPTGINGATALTGITGTLGSFTDADLFVFTITGSTPFSATLSSGLDTSIFLFDSTGAPLLANNDQSGTNLDGAIPAVSLAAGTYYLGIALSGNEPVNAANRRLFTADSPPSVLRGPVAGLNPASLSDFDSQTFYNEAGAYSLTLTGAATSGAVPEPSTCAALVAGGFALVCSLRRRQKAPCA